MAEWSGRPAYLQVADDLRAGIVKGTYTPGSQLPSYDALMKRYGVSITVVRSAIKELKTESLVRTHQGKGVFVNDPLPSAALLSNGSKRSAEADAAVLSQIDELAGEVRVLNERMGAVEREIQDHARLLARMRQRLENAGITLATPDQRNEQAM